MYVCMYVCMYACIFISVPITPQTIFRLKAYCRGDICMYVCMYACAYVCMHIYFRCNHASNYLSLKGISSR